MPSKMRSPLQYFVLLFLPLALVVLGGAFVYWSQEATARLAVLQSREMARVVREVQTLEMAYATRTADVAFLAERIGAELEHGRNPAKNIDELLQAFATVKGDYLAVRYLDAKGMEAARQGHTPEALACSLLSRLKDRSGQPAFRKAMTTPAKSELLVHISRMELAQPDSRPDSQPAAMQPVLHFSSPVRSRGGDCAGLVVLSLDGNVPLDRLRQAEGASLGRPLLVNQQGYWLLGPSPGQEWGFLLPGRAGATVEAVWPGAWERMRGGGQGQFLHAGALYSFGTVGTEHSRDLRAGIAVFSEERWLVVSRVGPEQIRPQQGSVFFGMTGGLLALLGVLSWTWALARARRDQALAELHGSEESARAILNAPQDAAFLLLGLDGRIHSANCVAEERFRGLFEGGLAGRSLWELGSQDLAEQRSKLVELCVRTGEALRFDDERQGLVLDNTLYPVRGADGQTRQVVLFSRDVTAERKAQERLHTLSRAVEQSPAIIVITNARGEIGYVNPSFTQKYGYTLEEALGQNPRLLKSGRHNAAFYHNIWRTLAEGRDWTGEICNRAKDGREVWEKASISPVLDDAGQVTHYVSVKEDVTEQRLALQALAENEEKIRAMSEASQDGMIMVDDEGRVVFWNRAAEKIFGYSREEMQGKPLHRVVAVGDDADRAAMAFPGFAQSGEGAAVGVVTELLTRRKDGTTFPVELSLGSFRCQGRWWAVGTVRDVTERKRDEALLVELATTDGLTGLNNRRYFWERGRAELGRARRTGGAVSCLMFDVDHFKKVNDAHGHDAGDAVLRALARTARDCLRDIDLLGRLGGEEFGALLPETGLEEALLVAERLRVAVAAMGLTHAGVPLVVTVSLGVACAKDQGETLESLLKRADDALYEAKQNGRNRVVASPL
ncbi:PAS domain S-box protein [Humidesulfovibrio sp.]